MQTACQPPCGVLVSNSNCVYDILESFVRILTTAAGGRTLSTSRVCLVQSLVCAGNAEEDSIKADVHYTCYVYAVYRKADVRAMYTRRVGVSYSKLNCMFVDFRQNLKLGESSFLRSGVRTCLQCARSVQQPWVTTRKSTSVCDIRVRFIHSPAYLRQSLSLFVVFRRGTSFAL